MLVQSMAFRLGTGSITFVLLTMLYDTYFSC